MIEGEVNAAYEAVVTLPLQDPEGKARDIEAVVDTGYNGFLTLPPGLIGLSWGCLSLTWARRFWLTGLRWISTFTTSPCSGTANRETSRPTQRAAPRSWVCCCSTATT